MDKAYHSSKTLVLEKHLTEMESYIAEKYSLIAETFVNTNDLETSEFFKLVFDSIFTLIPEAQKGSFYELDSNVFRPIYCKGYDFELLSKLKFSVDEAFIDFESYPDQVIDAYQVIIKKRDEKKFDKKTIEIFKKLGTYEKFVSLYAPIKFDDIKIGLISLENFDELSFSNNSKLLLKIYAQLISNFYTLKMHQKIEHERDGDLIRALVTAIEVKDKYTVGHAKRVADISDQIAIKLGISNNRRKMLKTAAILHDVGKIGIPDDILNKPGRLTELEYEIVKMHPENTKRILESINDFDEVIELAYMHHEHYDGSGYPRGLSGNEIPIEAQIIQCADAFDAMSSNRSYRKAMSLEKIQSIFIAERGKQFNPQIVDVLLMSIVRQGDISDVRSL